MPCASPFDAPYAGGIQCAWRSLKVLVIETVGWVRRKGGAVEWTNKQEPDADDAHLLSRGPPSIREAALKDKLVASLRE